MGLKNIVTQREIEGQNFNLHEEKENGWSTAYNNPLEHS